LIGDSEKNGDTFPSTVLAEATITSTWPGDEGLVKDEAYNAVIPAGTQWPTSNPPILTIELRFQVNTIDAAQGFWADNVRTGSFIGLPCNTPFADADADGDVDDEDFAVFQLCYTGAAGPIPTNPDYCGCLDRNNDTTINQNDFAAFEDCASGPDVPWAPSANCP
jgi:hypothetical protein